MLTGLIVGFAIGIVLSGMVHTWITREAVAVKADIAAEFSKLKPNLAKVKALIVKL